VDDASFKKFKIPLPAPRCRIITYQTWLFLSQLFRRIINSISQRFSERACLCHLVSSRIGDLLHEGDKHELFIFSLLPKKMHRSSYGEGRASGKKVRNPPPPPAQQPPQEGSCGQPNLVMTATRELAMLATTVWTMTTTSLCHDSHHILGHDSYFESYDSQNSLDSKWKWKPQRAILYGINTFLAFWDFKIAPKNFTFANSETEMNPPTPLELKNESCLPTLHRI
jgi:hypothetical protein